MQWTPEIWYHPPSPTFQLKELRFRKVNNIQYHAASKWQSWFKQQNIHQQTLGYVYYNRFFCPVSSSLSTNPSFHFLFLCFFNFFFFPPSLVEKLSLLYKKKKLCIINVYILKSLDRGIQLYYHHCNQSNKNSHPCQKFPLLFFWLFGLFVCFWW